MPSARRTRLIEPDDPALQYMGRIDWDDPKGPVWVYPYTQVRFRFTGTSLGLKVINRRQNGPSHLGVIIDGVQTSLPIGRDGVPVELRAAGDLPDIQHEAVIFKRQDGQHYLTLLGIEVDRGAGVTPPETPLPSRRMEVFGDSVSCGERNEASCYLGREDPPADLTPYSNSWYSYAAMTARNLNAQLHDISQGGASLLDGIGWFNGPDYLGMESIWDKVEYNPALGRVKTWDPKAYDPQVIVVALGQNDSHPADFMADDYEGGQARLWRTRYAEFIHALLGLHPRAHIILTTTILIHDPSWDRAIDQVRREVGDERVSHFLYSRNGSATPGHPRVAEHREMADELTNYIRSLGEGIWNG